MPSLSCAAAALLRFIAATDAAIPIAVLWLTITIERLL